MCVLVLVVINFDMAKDEKSSTPPRWCKCYGLSFCQYSS